MSVGEAAADSSCCMWCVACIPSMKCSNILPFYVYSVLYTRCFCSGHQRVRRFAVSITPFAKLTRTVFGSSQWRRADLDSVVVGEKKVVVVVNVVM